MSNKNGGICKICGDAGKSTGYHFNTITCEACKKFYIRQLNNEKYAKLVCVQSSNNCVINLQTRNNCSYCRFQKCVQVGMNKDEKHRAKIVFKDIPCNICSNSSSGLHYGVVSCESCKGFFRNYFNKSDKLSCSEGICQIHYLLGYACRKCRLDKCFSLGMSISNIKMGRQSYLFKQKLKAKVENENSSTELKSNQFDTKINISESNIDKIQDEISCDDKELIQMIDDSFVFLTNQITSFNQAQEYELVFEFFNSQLLKFATYVENIPLFREFSLINLQQLIHHAVYSLTILELTKSHSYTNLFNLNDHLYNEIIKNCPLFNSVKINTYINSIFDNIKQFNLDSREYGLFSLVLILSNAACFENETYLDEMNVRVTKALIDYMHLRRNEYDSSSKLIRIAGDLEKINLFIQHIIYQKYNELNLMEIKLDQKYSNIINFNRWFQQE